MKGCKCLILDFENDGIQKKGYHPYLKGKSVNSNQESRGGSFNDGFYRFRLFSTASVGTPVMLN